MSSTPHPLSGPSHRPLSSTFCSSTAQPTALAISRPSSSIRSLDSDCETDEENDKSNQENLVVNMNNFLPPPHSPSRKRSRLASPTRVRPSSNSACVPSSSSSVSPPVSFPFSDCVTLNVGGSLFLTTFSTLLSVPNTYFTARFAHNYADSQRSTTSSSIIPLHHYFIDRDGTHFRYILNYLRDRTIHIQVIELNTNSFSLIQFIGILNELLAEATFYGLDGMRIIIQNKLEGIKEMERENDMERREMKMKWEQNQSYKEKEIERSQSMETGREQIHPHSQLPVIDHTQPSGCLLQRSHSQPFSGLQAAPVYRPPNHAFPGPEALFQMPSNHLSQPSLSAPVSFASAESATQSTNGAFEFTIDADF
jgi:hypothetical protein